MTAVGAVSAKGPDEGPVVVKRERPEYPLGQRIAGYSGEVTVEFIVDTKGEVQNAFVAKSTNPAFDESAITAVLQWRFKPGMNGGKLVNTRLQVPIVFRLDGGGKNGFEVQSSRKVQKALPPELRYDVPPQLTNLQPAVYPYGPLLAKVGGVVDFAFFIDTTGRAQLAKIFESPGDEFTAAVVAMIDVMQFTPAKKARQPTDSLLRMKLKFNERTGDVALYSSGRKILSKLRKEGETATFGSARDLDTKLTPLSRKPPLFPRSVSAEVNKGDAMIEFFIDEHGIAQLPHIISSSDPAFGYAACQAIAAWRFTPPLENDKPVVVRVRVPVGFKRE